MEGNGRIFRPLATLRIWQLAIEEKSTGDFCGVAGLWNPEGWPETEVGWGLIAAKEGRGYASEAGQKARAYAYETLGWETLISCIDSDNEAFIRVAERLGARYEKEVQIVDGRFLKTYRHPAPVRFEKGECTS